MSTLRLDLTPLRVNRDFRYLWASGIITGLGSFATYVALPYQLAKLTGSYVAVGVLGLLEVVPLIVFGLWGGVLADRHDRRVMLFATECTFVVLVAVAVVNASLSEPKAWPIYVVSVLLATVDGLQRPSLDALVPRLVSSEHLPAASALNSLRGNIAHVVGPALGGILIAVGGVRSAYLFDIATFIASVLCIAQITRVPSQRTLNLRPVDELREAIRYVRTRRDIIGTYLVDTIAMVFAFPFALFPFIAREFNATWSLGFLYSSFAVGSFVATLTSRWTQRIRHHGRALVVAACLWGIAIAMASVVPSVYWVLGCFCVAGAADMVSGLFRSLIWNLTIPDELRGRMAGIEMLSYSIGPQIGQVRSSLTARLTSLRTSLFLGGAVCAGSVSVLPRAIPELWAFTAVEASASNRHRQQGI